MNVRMVAVYKVYEFDNLQLFFVCVAWTRIELTVNCFEWIILRCRFLIDWNTRKILAAFISTFTAFIRHFHWSYQNWLQTLVYNNKRLKFQSEHNIIWMNKSISANYLCKCTQNKTKTKLSISIMQMFSHAFYMRGCNLLEMR